MYLVFNMYVLFNVLLRIVLGKKNLFIFFVKKNVII